MLLVIAWVSLYFSKKENAPCHAAGATTINTGIMLFFCAIGSERIARHNHLRNAIHEAAAQAALAPQKEPPGFIPGSDERPAEICSLYNMYN